MARPGQSNLNKPNYMLSDVCTEWVVFCLSQFTFNVLFFVLFLCIFCVLIFVYLSCSINIIIIIIIIIITRWQHQPFWHSLRQHTPANSPSYHPLTTQWFVKTRSQSKRLGDCFRPLTYQNHWCSVFKRRGTHQLWGNCLKPSTHLWRRTMTKLDTPHTLEIGCRPHQ